MGSPASGGLDGTATARLQKAWDSIDLIAGVEAAFVGERALGADFGIAREKISIRQVRQSFGAGGPPSPGVAAFAEDYVVFPAIE